MEMRENVHVHTYWRPLYLFFMVVLEGSKSKHQHEERKDMLKIFNLR